MSIFTFEAGFQVTGPDRSQLEEAVHDLIEQLLGLEEAGCGIHSSAVSVDFANSEVEVEVAVDGDNIDVAQSIAQSCIRAAIHGTGGATPNWVDVAPKVHAEPISA